MLLEFIIYQLVAATPTNELHANSASMDALSQPLHSDLQEADSVPFTCLDTGTTAVEATLAVPIKLHGEIANSSMESFVRENAPCLLKRCDVADFLKAKNPKLRRILLHNLYANGCIDWKLLGRLTAIAKQNKYI